jgi:uncharacterized protein
MGGGTRTWRLLNIEQGLRESEGALRTRAAQALGLDPGALRGFRIARRSVDARRRRGGLRFVCHVDLVLDRGRRSQAMGRLERSGRLESAPGVGSLTLDRVAEGRRSARVVVVGSGPAGLFAALALAINGVPVDLIERGAPVQQRAKRVVPFHRGGPLDPDTNLLFGEGGAGTYSDGKLYTRVRDDLEVVLLEELVACGAPEDILFDSRAHLGTDRLHRILPRLRARLEQLGVVFHFDTRLEALVLDEGPPRVVRAVRTSRGELGCDALVLAVGHSARDTWKILEEQGVPFEAKPFQLGVRVEHPQELVTRARYGSGPDADLLGPASYQLTCRAGDGLAGAHSFCMCPGGRMVASVNEPGLLCTNGMSNSRHSSRWANAAIVTTFTPESYAGSGAGPFAGVEFQRGLERRFFEAGGGGYVAPAQRVPDFIAGRLSKGELATSYPFGATPGRLDTLLPPLARDALRRALIRFERPIPGFSGPEGLMVGLESRSSGPVRIPRDRDRRVAQGWDNLLPVGEGAGYAGGIMSAALDGARSALGWLAGR